MAGLDVVGLSHADLEALSKADPDPLYAPPAFLEIAKATSWVQSCHVRRAPVRDKLPLPGNMPLSLSHVLLSLSKMGF